MSEKVPYYIQGMGSISPQKTFDNAEFLNEIQEYQDNVLSFITPDFKNYIHPVKMRRMSRILRAGLTAAKICTQEAKLDMPDAIITASGYGCITDTSKFMLEVLENGEKQLTPTFFMQSTYNSVSGLIALEMKCTNYNTTYVHRGFAFENALQDSMMQIEDIPSKRILVGAFDETNAEQFILSKRRGLHKRKSINSLSLFESDGQGTLQGEGTSFFTLGTTITDSTYCRLVGLKTLYAPKNELDFLSMVETLLAENNLSTNDIDVVIKGNGGDTEKDAFLNQTTETLFRDKAQLVFKHLSGDFCTASSFGMWLGARILKEQRIPDAVKANRFDAPSTIKNVLLINHFWGKNCSAILLQAAYYLT